MSPEEQREFLAFCDEARTPSEYTARMNMQAAFLAGFRAGRMHGWG